MKGRPTTDPKLNPIKFRVNDEMNQWVLKTSDRKGITVSQLLREIISKEMNRDLKFSEK